MASPIRTVAKYERKILMRSWFFRIFSIFSLFVLFVFNMGEISEVGDTEWGYRAVPSTMPYAYIFLLNLAQAIIAIFLSSEFIKRDRKQDTTEVIYVRSMSNGSYLLGKTWSILSIFLIINMAALGLGLIFNLLGQNTYVDWQAYLYYPLLISLPSILFLVGLSAVLMCIMRNQALTFVLLIGLVLSSMIYLKTSYHYLFDCMAFYQPLFHSDIIGFGHWEDILRIRGMYASFGVGFIFISILLFKRLPQSRLMNGVSLIIGLAGVSLGTWLGYQHIQEYQVNTQLPKDIIALNNTYLDKARIDIDRNAIELEQKEDGIVATSKITGKAVETADEFVFSLNPGLSVSSVQDQQGDLSFERKINLLLIQARNPLEAGQEINWTITYEGSINEEACFLDVSSDLKYERYQEMVCNLDQRYAFTEPNFLLLTPEAQWYPTSGVGYSDASPLWYRKDFIDYQLTVKTLPGLTPVSTGTTVEQDSDTYTFDRPYKIAHLALSIGNYRTAALETDSLTFQVYYIDEHDYFKNAFPDIRDTLVSVIRERLGDFERKSDLKYPFSTFSLVEVPAQFKSFDRSWTSIHETTQPGLVFIPERGMHTRNYDFEGMVKRRKRWSRNRDRTDAELQMMGLNSFLQTFFEFKDVNTSFNNQRVTVDERINPFYQFVQLYEMCNNLESDEWPVLNRIFESYLRSEGNEQPEWLRRNTGSTQYELANMVLQEKSFAEILTLKENQSLIDNVIELKGDLLFSMIQAQADTDRFREFITDMLADVRFENLSFEDFNRILQEEFDIDLSSVMAKWFHEIELPRYLISTPVAEKVLAEDRELTRIRMSISNQGTAEGVVKITLRPGEEVKRLVYLNPNQTKELYYLTATEPTGLEINTLASGNLPNQIEYNFDQIDETGVKNARESQRTVDKAIVLVNEGEIIVDNESADFDYSIYEEVSRLRKWLKPDSQDEFKYQGTRVWRPPFNWTATTDDKFFGEFVRSALYIKAGDGSKAATWRIPIPESGRYEVFYHVYKDDSFRWNRNQRGNYRFTIPHENGTDEPTVELHRDTPEGWTSLGDYSFAADTLTVSLSNETRLRAVFADAVKLVRMD